MKDEKKTKKQLIEELHKLRRRLARCEASKSKGKGLQETSLRSERSFRALAASANDGILIANDKGRYVYANKRASRITGYRLAELLKIGMKDLTHPDEVRKVTGRFRKRMMGESAPRQYETVIVRKDGKSVPIELTAAKTVWHGQPAGLAIIRDITERRRTEESLRQSEEKYKALVESSLQGIVILQGIPTRIVFANPVAARILGFSVREFLSLQSKDIFSLVNLPSPKQRNLLQLYRERLRGKPSPTSQEFCINRPDGTTVWVEVFAKGIEFDGKPAVQVVLIDITERKQAEEALRESEERFRLAFEGGPLGMALVGRDFKLLKVNKTLCKLLGYTDAEMSKFTFVDITHPEDIDKDVQLAKQVFEGKMASYKIEKRYIKKNREILWANLSATVIRGQNGKTLYGLAMIEDITERKGTEETLRESEQQYRSTINSMSDVIHMIDKDFRVILINPAFRKWTKMLKLETDVVGRTLYQAFPFLSNKIRNEYQRVFRTGQPLITEERTEFEGQEYITETRKIPILDGEEVVRIITVIRDFTEQRRAEEALRESEEQYRSLVEESLQGLVITQGFPPRVMFANSKIAEITGYTIDELSALPPEEIMSLVHVEDQAAVTQRIQDLVARESGSPSFELRVVRKDRIVRWVQTFSTNMLYRGEPAMQTAILDITERKEAERELREREEYHSHLIENASDIIAVVEQDGTIRYISPSVKELCGHEPDDLIDTSFFEHPHPEDASRVETFHKNAVKAPGVTPPVEYRMRREDGSWAYLESVGNNLLDNPVVEGVIITSRDITERKRTEEELKKYREHLEELVDERTAELQKANERLKREIQERKQMGEALRESEERYRSFVQNFQGIAYRGDGKFTPIFFHGAVEDITGYTEEEFTVGKPRWDQIIHPDDLPEVYEKAKDLVTIPGSLAELEYRIVRKDGHVRWVRELTQNICQDSRQPVFIQGAIYDITERKQAEEALRQSEQTMRALLNAPTDSAWVLLDSNGIVLATNEAAAERLGKSAKEFLSSYAFDHFPPDVAKYRKQKFDEVFRSGKVVRFEDERSERILDTSIYPVFDAQGKVQQVAGFSRDITERKRAEEALRAERDKLEIITKNIGVGLAIISKDYRTLWANEVLTQIFGNVEGKLCYTTYNQRTDVCPGCGVKKVFTTGKTSVVHEQVGKDAEGNKIWSQIIATPIKDEKGNITAAHEVVVPITERKRMELTQRALQQIANAVHSTEDLGELFEAIHQELGTILNTENFFIALLDKHSDTISFPYHKDERDPYVETLPVGTTLTGYVIRTSKPLLATKTKIERMAKTGLIQLLGEIPEIWLGVPMRVRNKKIGALVVQNYEDRSAIDESDLDILRFVSGQVGLSIERKRAEEQLKETLEELARSNAELEQFAHVASHDLQEPLQAVAMSIEIVAKRHKGKFDAQADKFIKYAVDESNRMQMLVQDLLAYSRVGMGGMQFEPTDCLIVLDQTLDNLMVPIEQSDAKITHGPLPTVMGDPLQLTQVLQNLIDNAIKFRREEPPRIHVSAKRKGGEWVFAVRDNGMGFDSEHAEKIFAAFERLLDKTRYLGSGIGLAICRKIVERHGGRIWAESKPGEGATFCFTLPVMKGTSR